MIPLIAKLSSSAKKVPGGPIVQGVVVLAFLLVAYLAIRAVLKGLGNDLDRVVNPPVDPIELVEETPTLDGTESDSAFTTTAEQVANAQHAALNGNIYPTTTGFLFALLPYNGAQLQEIYSAHGIRQGKDLFGHYNEELHSIPTGFNTEDEYDGQVPGCESSFNFCSQRTFARNLWQKSGLPITF